MTTPVGSIRLGLTVDGSGVWGDITREVMERLSPALDEITSRLGALESQHKATGEAAKKAGSDQAAAAKTAKTARDDLRRSTEDVTRAEREFNSALEIFGKRSPQAAAAYQRLVNVQKTYTDSLVRSAAESRSATDSQIADYRRLARAADEFQAKQERIARSAGFSGGGGGGGSSGGRGFGGGGGRRGGALGFLTGPIGLNSLALGASALPPVTLAVTNLVGAVQQLGQAGLVIPGVIGGIVASTGTAALGFQGMGDAIDAMNEAAKSGDPKDLEKVAELLKDMDPAAIAVAKSISKFTQGPLKDLRMGLQSKMFAGVDQSIDTLVEKRMPNLVKGTGLIGEAWNATFKKLAEVGGLDSTGGILDRIFGSTAEGQKRANAAIEPLVKGIGTLTAAGTETLPRLGDALTRVSTRFSDFITKADGDGRLDKWIDQGLTGVTNLGNTFLNLGKSIASITQAAGGDGGLLKMMEGGTQRLAEFLGSAEGQEKLTRFFDDARTKLSEWIPILGNVANVIGDVFQGFQRWGDVILPAVSGITDALSGMGPLVSNVVTAFLAWKTISGVTSLIGSITTLGGLLDGLGGKGSTAGKGISAGLQPATIAITAAITAINELNNKVSPELENATLDNVAPPELPWNERLWNLFQSWVPGSQFQPPKTDFTGGLGGPANASRERRGAAPLPVTQIPRPTAFDPAPLPIAGLQPGASTPIPAPPAPAMPDPGALNVLQGITGAAHQAKDGVGSLDAALGSLSSPPPVKIDADTSPADSAIKSFIGRSAGLSIRIKVNADMPALPSGGGGGGARPSGSWFGGSADGGVLPGYSPGVDNMLWPMSGGEGVVIPEAMRALGPSWLYNLNSRFRAGLSRRGYADGGVLPGGVVGLGGDSTVVNLLSQIRDLLAGKSSANSPLNATADGVAALADGVTGIGTGGSGSGTSKTGGKRSLLWDTAASFISMFGGDPYAILGPDPAGGGAPGVASGGGASSLISGLTGFARSGNFTPDLATLGLAPNSSVIKAITSARGKKNGLGGDGIASLIEQVLGTGTYTGALDGSNSSLINALLKLTGGVPAPKTPSAGPGADAAAGLDGAALPSAPGLPGADIATPGAPIPVYIVAGPGAPGVVPGGAGGLTGSPGAELGQNLATSGADALTQALGGALQQILPNVLGRTMDAVLGTGRGLPTGNTVQGPGDTPVSGLANLLGFKVTDFTRAGGAGDPLMRNEGPQFDANGRLMSDSSVLVDRTLTNMEAANQARHKQLMELTSQMRDLLTEKFLKPTMQAATTAGINGISSSVTAAMGSSMGASAAGPIASAVKSAIPVSTGRAGGGVLPGYSPGVDNLLVPMSGGEGVLIPEAVRGLGGPNAIYAINSRFRSGLSRRGYGPGFASGGVLGGANATVGAEFFGVSQVPILADIVNMLVSLLLSVIGVQITTRDTLTDMTQEIRGFRGDFSAFDATGRLSSDTAGLTARSQTSRQIAEQQRMRILKDVIIGALRFVIEDILIPLLKAAIQAAINFGTQAISGAVGAAASGASFGAGGGLASALTNAAVGALGSIAQAAADIMLDILSNVLTNGAEILVEALGNAISGLFPTILGSVSGLLSGIGGALTGLLKMIGGPFLAIGRLVGGLFDEGGVAMGAGVMLKGTQEPERVLSPGQTKQYDRILDTLDRLYVSGGTTRYAELGGVTINVDSEDAARKIGTHLTEIAFA